MDPYLENPVIWPSIQQRYCTYLGDALTAILPPRYVANINERVSVDEPDRDLYPDASVLEWRQYPPALPPPRASTAAVLDPPWLVELSADEIREPFIEILPAEGAERVVTVIEFLSPGNKAAGSRSRERYRTKQREILASPTHLLEIDLLRTGEHSVAAPRDRVLRRGQYDYLVSLSRGNRRNPCEVWGIPLFHRLPRVAVPLLEGDDDVVVDLQELFARCYDLGGYARRVDYRRPPPVALAPADAARADELLRQHNLRP
jgi:hypothetical protein